MPQKLMRPEIILSPELRQFVESILPSGISLPAAVAYSARMKRRRGALREEILNAPNVVTLARIALIPLIVVLLSAESRRNSFWAAIVFGVASGTDFLDGWLARRYQLITTFGKFLDPLADKLITTAAYIVLVYLSRVPAWVVLVIVGREFIINGLRTIAISEGIVIAASQGGKWKTALQLAGIAALIVNYTYPVDFVVTTMVVNFHEVGLWLTYLSLIPSIWSAVDYFRGFVAGVFDAREDQQAEAEGPAQADQRPGQPMALTGS